MGTRKIKLKEPGAKPCPKCGNKLYFTINSEQISEDCCEIYAECKCGYVPSDWKSRIEDVYGGCDDENCLDAVSLTWNDLIEEAEYNQNK